MSQGCNGVILDACVCATCVGKVELFMLFLNKA